MSKPAGQCPNCSAPLVFQWSSAVQTVCASCRSVVVRHDVNLEAIGEVSDLRSNSSPIQIGTRGTFEGRAFQVTGRIAYEYDEGGWNEWHLAFADQSSGWLSDAQLEYAVSRLVPSAPAVPPSDGVKVGLGYRLGNVPFEVTTITQARYRGVDGELPFEYWGKETVAFADLRAAGGRFATIDYSEAAPLVFTGRFVEFDDLALTGLQDVEAGVIAGTATRGFNCANCGAAIELRAVAHTRTVACTSCGAILDPADPNVRILQAAERVRVLPKIPLGSKGEWHGHPYQVIGFQQRSISVEGLSYGWEEYVLFNPLRGYRYLSEYQGHWNDIRTVRDLLEVDRSHARARVGFEKKTFKHFQHATARTDFVLGEFPWRVRAGDTAVVDDFVDDERWMLSGETTGEERTWSLGEYTPGSSIYKAFGVAGDPPTPAGIFANQPNPFDARLGRMFGLFFALAAVLAVFALGRLWTADREVVFSHDYRYVPVKPGTTVEQAFVTDPFTFSADSNVEVDLNAGVTNAWFGWDLALINTETGIAYNAASEVEYYAGVDADGAWSEGNRARRMRLPRLPAGEYYLRVDPESNSGIEIPYSIRIVRDVPSLLPYGLAFLMLLVPPCYVLARSVAFDQRRMQESDYAGGDHSAGSGDDSGDEED